MKKTKLIPAMTMLTAGAVTGILTLVFQYDMKDRMLMLLLVMLVFLVIGEVIRFLVEKYLIPVNKTEEELAEESVIEKDAVDENGEKEQE